MSLRPCGPLPRPFRGHRPRWPSLASAGLLSLGTVPSSLAFAAGDAPAPADETIVLDSVRVTARRAEEDARDVPFSLSVLGGEAIEAKGSGSLESLLSGTPGLGISTYGDSNNANVKIRGVGSLNRVGGDDSSVVLYQDGMPDSVSGLSSRTFDMERIEILKGPQGTLYGRNSEAGAITLTSRRPGDTLEGTLRAEGGSRFYRMTEGAVGGPLVDALKGRLAFRYSGQDSWVDNVQTGEPLSEPTDLGVRGILAWEPGPDTSLTLIGQHDRFSGNIGLMIPRPYGEDPTADYPDGSVDERKDATRFSAELTHTFGGAVATLFSGYTRSDYTTESPLYEGTTYGRLIGMVPDSNRRYILGRDAFNQEIRLSSRPQDKVFWVAGANYYKSTRTVDTRDSYDSFYPGNPFNATIDREISVDSGAVFGEVTYPLTEALKLTAGLRQTWEHKSYESRWVANASNPNPIRSHIDRQSLSDSYTTGRLGLGYDLSPEVTVYGLYARGYKSGDWGDFGTNAPLGLADDPYKAATVDSYELGLKSSFLDGRATLNVAGFFNQSKDDHLILFDTVTYATQARNFDTQSMGVEMEGSWRLGHGFTLGGSAAYTHATITKVPGSSSTAVARGNKVPETPAWGWSLSLSHEQDLPDFLFFKNPSLVTSLQNKHVGQRAADPENNFDLHAYNKVDLRVGVSSDAADFYVRAENLLDERYDLYGYYYPAMMAGGADATIGWPAPGRSIIVGAAYHF
ncbi:TonB-dependent receptor [Pararhodospirillum oryzae]|uniref:TonB-dependent receptor n=1 Tax=Pararhodospirillum oryzae TaxID=478448 RepID=A0A512H385_9PROT|nr:TonB-dependent receptor [Pararhodospirillum oryzae]GEO79878.1 TonB-dependent receptor [Pararhodospirillum oryzae]